MNINKFIIKTLFSIILISLLTLCLSTFLNIINMQYTPTDIDYAIDTNSNIPCGNKYITALVNPSLIHSALNNPPIIDI